MRRAVVVAVVACLLWGVAAPAAARPWWKRRIDNLASGRKIGIAARQGGRLVYRRGNRIARRPASNQKLVTAMALLDHLGPRFRLSTVAAARRVRAGVVRGPLWVLGRGDPSVARGGAFARSLPFRATRLRRLALRIRAAGVRAIRGRVVGSTGYFRHDWDAPGWRSYYRSLYIALPSALTIDGNTARGRHVSDPERHAARALKASLRAVGVRVQGRAVSGRAPRGLRRVAKVRSRPLGVLVRHMNRVSSNFFAEVLGKRLAVAHGGRPGTIAKAARALESWARARGVRITAHDASGLSHANRMSPGGIVRLLAHAHRQPWGRALWRSLPRPGRGTLDDRLRNVRVRAKTGTLIGVSALSGWVWRRRAGGWATFSILSAGMPKHRAAALEDRIVRLLARSGRPARTAALSGRSFRPLA